MDALAQDLRYALRLLARNPLFALTAAVSLAIGIGATTTIFTLAGALLFRPPAGVVDASRLVDIGRSQNGEGFDTNSYPNYLDVRERSTRFEAVYAYRFDAPPMSLGGPNGAERVFGGVVSDNYFQALGVPTRFDGVVLSHRLWKRRFHADRAIVGRTLQINGRPFTVTGVAEEGFQGTTVFVPDLWIPMSMAAAAMPRQGTSLLHERGAAWLMMGGRLKRGATLEQAQAELASIGAALEREYPRENEGRGLRAAPLSPLPRNSAPVAAFITGLMGVAAVVLLVACANVAGVLLARATSRRREIAVRLALGARRTQLLRQLLVETVLLCLGAAAIGLLFAQAMTTLLLALLPALPVPIGVSLALDWRAAAFAIAISLLAALLSGIAPAFHASKGDVAGSLKADAQTAPERMRLRNAFVVAQVALSVVLVAGAGLFLRALQRAATIDAGFDPRHVEVAELDLSLGGYTPETGPQFTRQLIERVRALHGVEDASLAAMLPLSMGGMGLGALTLPGAQEEIAADWNAVEPRYFSTLRTPLLRGRDFTDADDERATSVAIVNETLARRLWPNQEPIGRTLLQNDGETSRTLTIVGVARDAKYRTLGEAPRNYIHVPLRQQYNARVNIVVRARAATLPAIRRLVASMNPRMPIVSAQPLAERAGIALVPQRVAASVTGGLGLVGLLLAALGIYGVTAYLVTTRTREIGIRMALGAERSDIMGLILRQGMKLVAIGIIAGLLLAAGASRVLGSLLFGVGPADPVVFLGAAALFCAAGAAACFVPVRRATAIDATVALRAE